MLSIRPCCLLRVLGIFAKMLGSALRRLYYDGFTSGGPSPSGWWRGPASEAPIGGVSTLCSWATTMSPSSTTLLPASRPFIQAVHVYFSAQHSGCVVLNVTMVVLGEQQLRMQALGWLSHSCALSAEHARQVSCNKFLCVFNVLPMGALCSTIPILAGPLFTLQIIPKE